MGVSIYILLVHCEFESPQQVSFCSLRNDQFGVGEAGHVGCITWGFSDFPF